MDYNRTNDAGGKATKESGPTTFRSLRGGDDGESEDDDGEVAHGRFLMGFILKGFGFCQWVKFDLFLAHHFRVAKDVDESGDHGEDAFHN